MKKNEKKKLAKLKPMRDFINIDEDMLSAILSDSDNWSDNIEPCLRLTNCNNSVYFAFENDDLKEHTNSMYKVKMIQKHLDRIKKNLLTNKPKK